MRLVASFTTLSKLPLKVVDERQAVRFARDYEHIVIDTGARPNLQDLKTLAGGCDLLVIPTSPDALALDALLLLVDALEEIGADQYRVLLTMIPPKSSRDGEQARKTLAEVKLPLFEGKVRRLAAFQKAALEGVPVYEVKDPRAVVGWKDYVQVGEEVVAGG
jgi:chromosome partitioning protein